MPRKLRNIFSGKMIRHRAFLVLTVLAFYGLATNAASASTPKPLGTFKDWKAFSMVENGSNVCFVVSTPKDKNPKNVKRGDVFFIITNWGNARLEPSITTGYPYKTNSKARIKIGADKFELFTQDDGAWLSSEAAEKRTISSMKRGSSMVITGTSQRGTLTTDRYSLSGVTAALDKIIKSCK